MKRKKPFRCVCCGVDVTGQKAKRLPRKRAVCGPCEARIIKEFGDPAPSKIKTDAEPYYFPMDAGGPVRVPFGLVPTIRIVPVYPKTDIAQENIDASMAKGREDFL